MEKDELIQNHLSDLKLFVESKDTINSKSYLDNLPEALKGKVFEEFVALLYRGNGWIAEPVGGRNDKGADILIRHPQDPTSVKFIIQTKNHKTPLNKKDTLSELNQFIDEGSKKYKCNQYRIIAINEFVEDTKPLQKYNLRLDGWFHITELFKGYNKTKNKEPDIGLHPHNKIAYDNLENLWEENKRVAIIQATGTGKSYIIYKAFSDFIGKTKILLVPSNAILNQFKHNTDFSWLLDSKTKILLYHNNKNFKDKNIANLKADLIVLDEFHRVGAKGFNIKIQKLLDHNPNAYVLGTSATPVRYLDNGRDMCEEIFAGVFASNLTLPQAIVSNILPNPIYIASLYSLEQDTAKLKNEIGNSNKSKDEKAKLTKEVEKIKLDWEKSSGASDILKKYLQGTDLNKFIVFCEGVDHLDKMIVEVESWFQKAGFKKRMKFQAHSKLSKKENSDTIDKFTNANQKDCVILLFAVDMLNEGVHIPDVSGVLLLRPTASPIIFYQQIGRCLQVGNTNPIIFDFVNNFNSIRARDFLNDLKGARENERSQRKKDGVNDDTPDFKIEDESKNVIELFKSIQETIASWEIRLQEFKEFYAKEGHPYVAKTNPETESLGVWCSDQRTLKSEGRLIPERIKKLEDAGFSWFPNNEKWERKFLQLKEYKERFKRTTVTTKDIKNFPEYYELHHWLRLQKRNGQKPSYIAERRKRLEEIGFDFSIEDVKNSWQNSYKQLQEYKNKWKNCNVPQISKEYKQLGRWLNDQRNDYGKGKMLPERKELLNAIGVIWNVTETEWESNFQDLKKYFAQHGNFDVKQSDKEYKGLYNWLYKIKKNEISKEKKERFEEIGFDFIDNKKANWFDMFNQLAKFKEVNGHTNPPKDKKNLELAKWVLAQKVLERKNELDKDKFDILNAINFQWAAPVRQKKDSDSPTRTQKPNTWYEMFEKLKKYKFDNGNYNVPKKYPADQDLSAWVYYQKQMNRDKKLSEEKIKAFKEIDFKFPKPKENQMTWEERFEQLLQFKKKNGHCKVPVRFKENRQFATWVRTQRRGYVEGTIDADKKKKLESVGFIWKATE